MTRPCARALVLLAAGWALGCGGGLSSDGGQSGTGIAAIRGTVVAVNGAAPGVAGIDVSVAATALTTRTDDSGRFELRGNLSGPVELRFERQRDGLLAAADIVIPAGGVLELEEIVLDSDTGEAHPARQVVDFEATVAMSDCTGGVIRVQTNDDDSPATVFTIEVASATIRRGSVQVACGDVQVGDQVQVRGDVVDGTTLVNAVVMLEDGPDGHEDHAVELQGVVETLDCAAGAFQVQADDDDAAASRFTVQVATATIRRGDVRLTCGDLRVGDRVQVTAETADGTVLIHAEVVLENHDGERAQPTSAHHGDGS